MPNGPGQAKRPHLIVIVAEQLRCDALDTYGPGHVPTPQLNQLAEQSAVFERHFATCPVAGPSKASIMTGLPPLKHGAVIQGGIASEAQHATVRDGLPLLPQHLASHGYRVEHVGLQAIQTLGGMEQDCPAVGFHGPASWKTHLQDLEAQGLMYPNPDDFREPLVERERERPVVMGVYGTQTAEFPLREDHYLDAKIATQAASLIEDHAAHNGDTPLALFVMLGLPSPPLWVTRRSAELIHADDVRLPPTTARWYPEMPATQLLNTPGQLGGHVPPSRWRDVWAAYLGMVHFLDTQVGHVLAAIDQAHWLDESAVVFTASHGEMLGSHRLFGGGCLYEQAIRVPLLIKPPKSKCNLARTAELTTHLDLTQTLTDLAAAPPLPGTETYGETLSPFLQGHFPNHEPREHIIATYDGYGSRSYPCRMLRSRSHKLIHNIGALPELYDLIDDPRETRNFVRMVEGRELRRSLRKTMAKELDALEDPQPRYGP